MKNKDSARNDVCAVVEALPRFLNLRPVLDEEKQELAEDLFDACRLMVVDPATDNYSRIHDVFREYRSKKIPLDIDGVSKQILSALCQTDGPEKKFIFLERAFNVLQPCSFPEFGSSDDFMCIVDDDAFVKAVVEVAYTTISRDVIWKDEVLEILVNTMCLRRYQLLQNDDQRTHALMSALAVTFPFCFCP